MLIGGASGNQQHRNALSARRLPQCPEQLDTIHVRHDDVGYNERGLRPHDCQECLCSVSGRIDPVVVGQTLRHVLAHRGFIFYKKQVRL
jgi:hypothetical protein